LNGVTPEEDPMSGKHTDRTAEEAIPEASRLRRCVRDLVALSTLPALWAGRDPAHIAESLADAEEDPFLDPDMRSFLPAKGIRTLLVVPLLLQGRLTGYYRLRSPHRENYGPRDLELAQALAHQATLAMHLTRLAEQARQTAVLQERERAAQERAAELARANQALLQTLDALAGKPELD
jgi:GAF domain-containing protein